MSNKQTLSTLIFFTCLLALSTIMLFTTIAKAASKKNGKEIERWGTIPALFAKAGIYGSEFNLRTQFSLDESIGLKKVEKLLRSEDLIKKYIPDVQSAQFTQLGPGGFFNFRVSIANFWGKKFAISFKCRDVHKKGESKTVLDQDCFEQQTNKSSRVLTHAVFTTDCFQIKSLNTQNDGFGSRHPGLQCDFGLGGKMHGIHSWFSGSTPGSTIAYNVFTALTSYTAQLGMRAGGNLGPCPHSDGDYLSCTVFDNQIHQLKARKRGLKTVSPTQTYVVTLNPAGVVQANVWYGDYAVESYTDMVASNQSGM